MFFQESTRITDLRKHAVRIPISIAQDKEASRIYKKIITEEWNAYAQLIDRGIEPEQARYAMPMGLLTYVGMAGNLRAWIGYFQGRLQDGAQSEHRLIADRILEQFKENCPYAWNFIKDKVEKK
jgi:thymidylate synthase ThyX